MYFLLSCDIEIKKLHHKWKAKKIIVMNEWMNEKPQKCKFIPNDFSLPFQA